MMKNVLLFLLVGAGIFLTNNYYKQSLIQSSLLDSNQVLSKNIFLKEDAYFNISFKTVNSLTPNSKKIKLEIKGLSEDGIGRSVFFSSSQIDDTLKPGKHTGTVGIQASNGNTIYGTLFGTTFIENKTGDIRFAGKYRIIGGNGLFKNAAGTGNYYGFTNIKELNGKITFTGTITKENPKDRRQADYLLADEVTKVKEGIKNFFKDNF